MTDADVAALARETSKSVARRIARHSPSARTGKLSDENAAPPEISVDEMRQIQRRGGSLSRALRQRLADAAEPEEQAEAEKRAEPAAARKQSPKREPPGAGEH